MLKVVVDRKTLEIIREEKLDEESNCEEYALDCFTDFILENIDFKGVHNENNK